MISRINNDVGQVQQAVSETVGDLARETLAIIGYATLLLYYDARLTLVCMTGAPLIVYPLGNGARVLDGRIVLSTGQQTPGL